MIEGKKYGRAEAYWEAFHNGKYIMGAGEEQFIDIDNDSITNNNPNTSRPNNNTTNPSRTNPSRTFKIDDYER